MLSMLLCFWVEKLKCHNVLKIQEAFSIITGPIQCVPINIVLEENVSFLKSWSNIFLKVGQTN